MKPDKGDMAKKSSPSPLKSGLPTSFMKPDKGDMAKKSSPSPWQSGLRTSNSEDVPRRRAPDSSDNDNGNRRSYAQSGGYRSQFKSKYEKDKNIARKRPYHSSVREELPSRFRSSDSRLPNESNAESYERNPKKRTSDSDEVLIVQKRSNFRKGKHMPEEKGSAAGNSVDSWLQKNKINADDGKDMPEKKGSASGECWNTPSNRPSSDPWLQKETNADEGNKKNWSTSSDVWNSNSSWPSWDSWQQKEANADKGKYMNDKISSASRDCLEPHSNWPSRDSWQQKKSGAEDSKHMSQNRVSSSGDRVGSHCDRPPWKSRWEKRTDFEMDKALVHEGGHNSSNEASGCVLIKSKSLVKTIAKETNDSPRKSSNNSSDRLPWKSGLEKRNDFEMDKALVHEGGHNSNNEASGWVLIKSKSLVKNIAKETNDSPRKSSNNSSDHLQLSSSGLAWKSELQIRSNVEGLKNTLVETTSRVIKSLKEDGLKTEVCSIKAQADGAKLHSKWPSLENTNNRSVERAETNVGPWESLQKRSNSTGEAKDGLLQGAYNSIGAAESPSALPSQNSNVEKSDDSKEVKDRFRKKAVDLYDHPSRVLEEQRVEDAHEARDVHNKGVNIDLDSQARTSCLSWISSREESILEKEKGRPNEAGFDKIDGDGLSHGTASWDSRTQIESKEGSKDGLLELSTSSWASRNCTEQSKSNLMKGNDTSTLRAINIIDAAELPSDRTSAELRMIPRGKEQAKDGSNKKLPNRIDSTGFQCSWHSHEPNVQIRGNLEEPKCGSNKKVSNRICSTELQPIWHPHESNMQRSTLEEPKAIPDESHVQRKGTLEEPKSRPDERTLKGTNGADCPSMLPCVQSKLQRSISAEEIEVSPRKQTSDPHGVQFPFIYTDYMQKGNMRASEITDGAEFPSTSPCKDLRLQRSIAAKEIEVSPRKEASDLVHGGTTFPLNRPVLELVVERKTNTEEAGDRVEGKVAVPTTQIPDVDVLSCFKDFNVNKLQNLVSDSAYSPPPSSKHQNSPAIINSTKIAPNCTKLSETAHCNHPHISRGNSTYRQSYPAKESIWMGSFEVTDIASVVRVYEGFTAHPSSYIPCKAQEFMQRMPSTLDFLIHPRCDYWPRIFEDCPDNNDIALYFYPRNKKSTHCYASLLKFIDNKDLMLRSQMGHVELLVFPSRLLDVRFQTIDNQYFFWGVFHSKRGKT